MTADTKARELLSAGHVQVKWATDGIVVASVRGTHGVYDVNWDSFSARWSCTCPEPRGCCSHVRAVQSVTMRRVSGAQP